jgi:hypothetical protein
MNKVISKKEFVSGYMPSGEGKEIQPPKIGLFPGSRCKINGNIYSISINEDGMIVLTKESN